MDADRARLWAVLGEYGQKIGELGVRTVLLHEPADVELPAFAAWLADNCYGPGLERPTG
jgi:hypothetical protein